MTTDTTWYPFPTRDFSQYEINCDGIVRTTDGSLVEPRETGSYILQSSCGKYSLVFPIDVLLQDLQDSIHFKEED